MKIQAESKRNHYQELIKSMKTKQHETNISDR